MKSIKYPFNDTSNLNEALTHSSYDNNSKVQNYHFSYIGDG